jgi:hypothetical protein
MKLLFGGPFHQCLSEAVALRGAARKLLLRGRVELALDVVRGRGVSVEVLLHLTGGGPSIAG